MKIKNIERQNVFRLANSQGISITSIRVDKSTTKNYYDYITKHQTMIKLFGRKDRDFGIYISDAKLLLINEYLSKRTYLKLIKRGGVMFTIKGDKYEQFIKDSEKSKTSKDSLERIESKLKKIKKSKNNKKVVDKM